MQGEAHEQLPGGMTRQKHLVGSDLEFEHGASDRTCGECEGNQPPCEGARRDRNDREPAQERRTGARDHE
jgi:hypothetical protein